MKVGYSKVDNRSRSRCLSRFRSLRLPREFRLARTIPEGLVVWVLLAALILISGRANGMIDADGDGISDVWARVYGAEALAPLADEDDDGMSNADEHIAGTDPFDYTSVLRVSRIEYVLEGRLLRWPAVAGITYRIESSESMDGASWELVGTRVFGETGSATAVVPRPSSSKAFFRIATEGDAVGPAGQDIGLLPDSDGDGHDDFEEFRAGTDPFDARSKLAITELVSGSGVALEFGTVPGKLYQLQSFNPQVGPDWVDEGAAILADGFLISTSIENVNPKVFLRVSVSDIDSDGDGATNWEEWATGYDPSRSQTYGGTQEDAQNIRDLLGTPLRYSLLARRSTIVLGSNEPGIVELRRVAGFGPARVNIAASGTAISGIDVQSVETTATIPPSDSSVGFEVHAMPGATPGREVEYSMADASLASGVGESASVRLVARQAISVMAYGATGDGVTDDTAAVQAAIDALEASPALNTLHFPAGSYRLATRAWQSRAMFTRWRLLKLGSLDLVDRDLFFTGDPGAVLFSDTGTVRSHMLLIEASFRSLSFRGLTWRKASTPLSEIPAGHSPNGADGVAVIARDGRKIAGIEFVNCVFTNCHASIALYHNAFDDRGKLRYLGILDCQILNPYGSNTLNSQTAWGGGQQVLTSHWLDTADYRGNLFDGGGEDLTDSATSPGGRLKDGSHFGSPLRLEFIGNVVKRMGVEAVYQTNRTAYAGVTTSEFTMPPADGVQIVSVRMKQVPKVLVPGDILNIRRSTTNTSNGRNNLFSVVFASSDTGIIDLRNTGDSGNDPPGTLIEANKVTYLNRAGFAGIAEVRDNWIDGALPPGTAPGTEVSGIVMNARSRITNNLVTGLRTGILVYPEVTTPLFPGSRWSVVDGNLIITKDPGENPNVTVYGINSWADDQVIQNNLIITPASKRFNGIAARGADSWVGRNVVLSAAPSDNGYGNILRAVGYGVGNQSSNVRITGNTSYGMDVGVGPVDPFQSIPHYVEDHRSIQDALPIDPRGLLSD